jgi:hypothetical protein
VISPRYKFERLPIDGIRFGLNGSDKNQKSLISLPRMNTKGAETSFLALIHLSLLVLLPFSSSFLHEHH